jgi:uncharacterized surface protein with fasciclin (FAS1) repeats
MVFVLPAAILALTAGLASAQQNTTYVSGLVQALNNAGLTSLATTIGSVNSTGPGSQLLSNLSNQGKNYTIFAPNNDAFSSASGSQDPTALTDVIAYHVVSGHFSNVTDYPNTTIGRTALADSSVVMLEGNKSQVVAWARREDGQVHVLNQVRTTDPHVVSLSNYQNLDIYVIDGILDYPGDLNSTFSSNSNLTGFADLARNTQVTVWDNSGHTNKNASVFDVLSGVRGLTFFAPSNQATSQDIPQLSGNETRLWEILRNSMLNGTTVYSSSLVNVTYTSAAGQYLHFSSNSSGKFVTSGSTTARIVQPDVLVKNGVVHIVDSVLVNDQVNEGAASSAYNSATEAAGHSSTETGAVGVPTGGSGGGSGSGGSNGAVGNLKGVSVSGVVALGVVLGSFFFA